MEEARVQALQNPPSLPPIVVPAKSGHESQLHVNQGGQQSTLRLGWLVGWTLFNQPTYIA